MLATLRTRVVSKGRYSSLSKSVHWLCVDVVFQADRLTSLLGRGARTYVSRDVVLGVKGLTGSREVASESKDMDGDAQRKWIGSCGRKKVKLEREGGGESLSRKGKGLLTNNSKLRTIGSE